MTYEIKAYVRCNRCNATSKEETDTNKFFSSKKSSEPMFPNGGTLTMDSELYSCGGRRDLCPACFQELLRWFNKPVENIALERKKST